MHGGGQALRREPGGPGFGRLPGRLLEDPLGLGPFVGRQTAQPMRCRIQAWPPASRESSAFGFGIGLRGEPSVVPPGATPVALTVNPTLVAPGDPDLTGHAGTANLTVLAAGVKISIGS